MTAQPWMMPAVMTLLMWGVWAFLPKLVAGQDVSPNVFIFYDALGGVVLAIIMLFVLKFQVAVPVKVGSIAIIASICGFGGVFFYFIALSKGNVAIVVSITALYPIITIILSRIFLGEVISGKQMIGMALAMVAIFLISSEE